MRYLHTMVRVGDLDAALDFYCSKLGLKELRRVGIILGIEDAESLVKLACGHIGAMFPIRPDSDHQPDYNRHARDDRQRGRQMILQELARLVDERNELVGPF